MSSQEKKKTIISEVSSSESRALSPATMAIRTRQQEKSELANLNDRLAHYIQRNRELQNENYSYIIEIRTLKESQEKEIGKTKALCEREIKDLRLALDEVSKQKAKCELDANRFRTEKDEAANKLKTKVKECTSLQKKVEGFESQIEGLNSKLNQSLNEKKKLEATITELNHDIQSANKQIGDLQRQLENETYTRVNLENQIQSLKEEAAFKESLHQEELSETRAKREAHLEQVVEEQIKEVYEQRMADELQELREMSEQQIRQSREEIGRTYEMQLKDLQSRFNAKANTETSLKNELQSTKAKMEALNSEINKLTTLNTSLTNRVSEMEKLIEQERNWAASALIEKDDEMKKLRDDLKEIHKEYQDLSDVKIALDLEINAYRKMLEGEETRLSLSPRKRGEEGTPSRLATPRAYAMPKKRKRVVIEDNENTVEFKTFSDSQGDVQISDYDQEGKYVKLQNKTDQDISLSGWQLIRKVGEKVTTTYKFNRTAVVKGSGTVTVWSAESKATHNPPTDLLMKTNWGTGDDISTSLLNPEGIVSHFLASFNTLSLIMPVYYRKWQLDHQLRSSRQPSIVALPTRWENTLMER